MSAENYRAALAQPEPEGLFGLDDLRNAWNAQADAANRWDELGLDEIIWFAQQQALARYGRPAVAPVAVSERPWEREGWCDAEGRCWVGHLGFREKVEETGEFFVMPDEWQLEKPELNPVFPCVLLPHWAIPLPTTTQETNR